METAGTQNPGAAGAVSPIRIALRAKEVSVVCMQYVNGTVELCYNLQKLDSGAVGGVSQPV